METTIFQIQRTFCSLVSYVSCENRSFPADFILNRSSEKMVKPEESIKNIAICPVGFNFLLCRCMAMKIRQRVTATCPRYLLSLQNRKVDAKLNMVRRLQAWCFQMDL